MAYMNQTKKETIAAQLKPIFKKYGVKATLAVDNHSTLVVNIRQGKQDFIKNYNKKVKDHAQHSFAHEITDGYMQVNPYHYGNHFSGECKKILEEIITTANKAGQNYNNSDIMSDYFDVGFYLDVNIGQWNKPYHVIGE